MQGRREPHPSSLCRTASSPQARAAAEALAAAEARAAERQAADAAAREELGRQLADLRARSERQLAAAERQLADLRAELASHSLLAGGLDECVEALVETEWESGDDGFIAARGERAAAMTNSLTVEQFRKRLQAHGLEGSLLELSLLTDALATALGAPETRAS